MIGAGVEPGDKLLELIKPLMVAESQGSH